MVSKMAPRSAGLELFHDIRQVGRVHLLQLLVGNVQPQAPQRVGLHHVAEVPENRIGRNGPLQPANPARRNKALAEPAENAAEADVHLQNRERVADAVVVDSHGDVGHAHHLPASHVDDLLVQQVAPDAQHVLVVVIRREHLVVQYDALTQDDGADLVVADGQPGVAAADQDAVDAGGADHGNQGGVLHAADAPALNVEHGHRDQFRKEQEVVRQWKRTHPRPIWRIRS